MKATNLAMQVFLLQKELQELRDEVSKMSRDYNDLLSNLDERNFAPEFLKKILT